VRLLLRSSNLTGTPLNRSWGISISGINIYIETTELRLEEIFSPIRFAKHAVLNRINQKTNVIPLISRIRLPVKTRIKVCNAESPNKYKILEFR
jgi:hypothetical protein